MRELSLFSGAGGGLLATHHLLGWTTVGYVENNDYCQRVIAARIRDGLLDNAPIFGDIRAFNDEFAEGYRGLVDVITGGFPCTNISASGDGTGIEGEQSGLWSEFARSICIIQPGFAFVENSPMLTSRGLGVVLGDLAQMGYDATWGCLSASQMGALHRRERIWIAAHATGKRLEGRNESPAPLQWAFPSRSVQALDLYRPWSQAADPRAFGSGDAVAFGLERIECIGNGWVPIMGATAWKILTGGC